VDGPVLARCFCSALIRSLASICGRPRPRKVFLQCFDQIACGRVRSSACRLPHWQQMVPPIFSECASCTDGLGSLSNGLLSQGGKRLTSLLRKDSLPAPGVGKDPSKLLKSSRFWLGMRGLDNQGRCPCLSAMHPIATKNGAAPRMTLSANQRHRTGFENERGSP
jgi:hypothetical protein